MNFAFIIRDLGYGGAQRQLVTLAKGLLIKGHQVSVIHFYDGAFKPELEAAGVHTVCVGKKSRWDLLGFFVRLVQTARKIRPQVLHGYLAESNLMALFLKPFCGYPKVIWGMRDSQSDAHLWGILGRLSFKLNCLLARFADHIVANSHSGLEYYAGRGFPRSKMNVIPNGIDTERFTPVIRTASEILTFGLVGRMNPMKDHATFLRAAALVPNSRFVCIGSGDVAYCKKMQDLAATLGIADRVTWMPAQIEMRSVYGSFDCLVSSSSFGEGFGNVIGEAMSCAVPCIASNVGDSAWLIDDPKRIFPAGDHQALAACMRSIPPGAQLSNRQRILDHFSVENLIERTERTMIESLSNSPAP